MPPTRARGRLASSPRDAVTLAASGVAHILVLVALAHREPGLPRAAPHPTSAEQVRMVEFPAAGGSPSPLPAPGVPTAGMAPSFAGSSPPVGPDATGPAATGSALASPPAGAPDATGAGAVPGTAARAPFHSGIRDPRLIVGPRPLQPTRERPLHQRLVEDAAAAIRAEPARMAEAQRRARESRQVGVFGRRVTVFGDSAAAGVRTPEMEARPDVQTLSVDGALWERLELARDREAFVRDSILRERARAIRDRTAR